MGVNCHIYLPMDARPVRVQDACVVLARIPHRLGQLDSGGLHIEHDVYDQMRPQGPDYLDLGLGDQSPLCHGIHRSGLFSHAERFRGELYNLFSPRSYPFWVAMGRRLAEWFGGVVVFNDCQPHRGRNLFRAERSCPVDEHGLLPDDGELWSDYHRALYALDPISERDMERAARLAAYPRQVPEEVASA